MSLALLRLVERVIPEEISDGEPASASDPALGGCDETTDNASLKTLKRSIGYKMEDGRDMLTVALLQRVLEELRARLAAGSGLRGEVEVGCRPETLLRSAQAFAECVARALGATSPLDLSLVCAREKAPAHSLEELNPDVWDKMKTRLLNTLPTPTQTGWVFDLRTRPGERLLRVPNDGRALEDYLKDPRFLEEMAARLSSAGVTLEAPATVRVGGLFLGEAQLDHVYGGDPDKKEAASKLDHDHWQTLTPETVEALKTGAFGLIPVSDRPAHELLADLRSHLSVPEATVIVNSDPDIDLNTLRPFVRGRTYGWTPANTPHDPEAILVCSKDSSCRNNLARVKTVMVFRLPQP